MERGETIDLMGDDGTPRSTVPGSQTCGNTQTSTKAATYRITSTNAGRDSWTCNNAHILVLKFNQQPSQLYKLTDDEVTDPFGYHKLMVDGGEQGDDGTWRGGVVVAKRVGFEDAANEAREQEADNTFVWECTVDEFLRCSAAVQKNARMFQPERVTFGQHAGKSLKKCILMALQAAHPAVPKATLEAMITSADVNNTGQFMNSLSRVRMLFGLFWAVRTIGKAAC
jgi:hypothetical protein